MKQTQRSKRTKSPRKDGTTRPTTLTGVSQPIAQVDPEKELAERIALSRWSREHAEEYREKFLRNIKARLPELENLLTTVEGWPMEDGFYRYYYRSWKLHTRLQPLTEEICKAFQELLPDRPLHKKFAQIVADGTGIQFDYSHNEDWPRYTRPIVEAFFHAHYFLKLTCKYGRLLDPDRLPKILPSGWEAVLYLFDLN